MFTICIQHQRMTDVTNDLIYISFPNKSPCAALELLSPNLKHKPNHRPQVKTPDSSIFRIANIAKQLTNIHCIWINTNR